MPIKLRWTVQWRRYDVYVVQNGVEVGLFVLHGVI